VPSGDDNVVVGFTNPQPRARTSHAEASGKFGRSNRYSATDTLIPRAACRRIHMLGNS
jgi:hypothetical protein